MLPAAFFYRHDKKPTSLPGHVVLDEEYEWVFGLKPESVEPKKRTRRG